MSELLFRLFSSDGFMPHGHCYLWTPSLVWTMATTDALIGLAYFGISLTLSGLVRRIRIPFSAVVLSFGVFIGACGATHLISVWTLWYPAYWLAAVVNAITAVASVATGVWLVRLRHPVVQVAEAAKLADQRRLDLEALTRDLEQRVKERTAELERANAALRQEMEERQRVNAVLLAITTTSPDVIYVKDRQSRMVYANPGALRLIGKPESEVLGRSDVEFLGPGGGGEAILENDRAIMESGQPRIVEEWVHTEGQSRLFMSSKAPYRDQQGRIIGLLGISREITERKRDEESLRRAMEESERSRGQLRQLADAMPQVVWTAMPDGVVDAYNQRWYEYTGLERGGTGDGSWQPVLHPEDRQRSVEGWRQAVAAGAAYEIEHRWRSRTGEYRWFLTRAVPARDATGQVARWIGTGTEIEDQKRAQARLEEAVRARDTFLSIASHELKTPVTSIKLQTGMMARALARGDALDRGRLSKLLTISDRQLDRLTHLVEDMLDVSRINAGRLELSRGEVGLTELLAETVERFEELSRGGGCAIELDAGAAALHGRWDRFRLEQVLSNLLSNAIKYGAGKPIRVVARSGPGLAEIRVIDQGIGIAPEHRQRIFERFERAVGTEISGLGLGLYIVKHIVEAHGGSIEVESEPGQGSTFIVRLPLDASLSREPGHA